MTAKFKRELKQLSQELDYYIIRGKKLKRIRFGEESDFIKKSECETCGVKPSKYHIWGCDKELSVCPKHPGSMIECPCDPEE